MQKVVGSSPIIRFSKKPAQAGFLLAELATKEPNCKRKCKRFDLESDSRGSETIVTE